jgi:hypothetical protein
MRSIEEEKDGNPDPDKCKNQDKNTEDTVYRISISKAAKKVVVEVMEKVNQDFTAGIRSVTYVPYCTLPKRA